MSSNFDFDLIVIGAGSGGVRASRVASSYGAKVAVIEEDRPGGTCVLRGCIPKKLMVYASHFREEVSDALGFGWKVDKVSHDWKKLNKVKNSELDRLANIYKNILNNAGCKIIRGRGHLLDVNTVSVGNKNYTAEKILISTGGKSFVPEIEGLREFSITSDEALNLQELPKNIIIFGSGYIAVEFAGIFNAFGSKVHLVYRADKPLKGFDNDIRESLSKELIKKGINLYPNTVIEKVNGRGGNLKVSFSNGQIINVDQVMAATGRIPNIEGLGLDKIGIEKANNGAIHTNEYFQSNIKSIYAIGDVTDKINLTPVALGEGHAFSDREYGNNLRHFSYENVPSAVFSQPPIASVGMSEILSIQKGFTVTVFESDFKPLKHTISGSDERTYMKLIVDAKTDIILGAHMIGSEAPEIIQGLAIAIQAGLTKSNFDQTIGIHPSAAEEFVTMRTPRTRN